MAALLFSIFVAGCFQYNSAFYRPGLLKEKAYLANHDAAVLLAYRGVAQQGTETAVTSGIVIDKEHGLVLTAYHGAEDLDITMVFVLPPPGEEKTWAAPKRAKLIAFSHDRDFDLAVFQVNAVFKSEATIYSGPSSALESEPVYLVSYPFGDMMHVPTFGHVIGQRQGRLLAHIYAQSGSSGGPLFRQKDHRLIGIFKGVQAPDFYSTPSFASPEMIRKFLEKNNIKYKK